MNSNKVKNPGMQKKPPLTFLSPCPPIFPFIPVVKQVLDTMIAMKLLDKVLGAPLPYYMKYLW